MSEDIREELGRLVKGEWRFILDAWNCELGNGWHIWIGPTWEGSDWRASVTFNGRAGFSDVADASDPDPVSALRALLTGKDRDLVVGILLARKALPWREEPDPELGECWERSIPEFDGYPINRVCRFRVRRWRGDIEARPIEPGGLPWSSGWLAVKGARWMLAVPPPSMPETPDV